MPASCFFSSLSPPSFSRRSASCLARSFILTIACLRSTSFFTASFSTSLSTFSSSSSASLRPFFAASLRRSTSFFRRASVEFSSAFGARLVVAGSTLLCACLLSTSKTSAPASRAGTSGSSAARPTLMRNRWSISKRPIARTASASRARPAGVSAASGGSDRLLATRSFNSKRRSISIAASNSLRPRSQVQTSATTNPATSEPPSQPTVQLAGRSAMATNLGMAIATAAIARATNQQLTSRLSNNSIQSRRRARATCLRIWSMARRSCCESGNQGRSQVDSYSIGIRPAGHAETASAAAFEG